MGRVNDLEEIQEIVPILQKPKSRLCVGERIVMEILLGLLGLAGVAVLFNFAGPLPSEADYKKALEKLDANPVDPDANTVVGKYIAFVTGDYSAAMPYLVHSSDKTLSTLADHELDKTYTDSAPKKVGIGDEWVSAAKKFPALSRIFYDRASQWYSQAWPDLDAVWKDKARTQGRKLSAARPQGTPKKGLPQGWFSDPNAPGGRLVSLDGVVSHLGSYSAKMVPADEKVPGSFSNLKTDLIPVSGKSIEMTAWVMTDGTESGKDEVRVYFQDQMGRSLGAGVGAFVPVDMPFWTRIYAKADLPDTATRAQLAASLHSKKGNMWIDDVSIKVDGKEILKNGSFD